MASLIVAPALIQLCICSSNMESTAGFGMEAVIFPSAASISQHINDQSIGAIYLDKGVIILVIFCKFMHVNFVLASL